MTFRDLILQIWWRSTNNVVAYYMKPNRVQQVMVLSFHSGFSSIHRKLILTEVLVLELHHLGEGCCQGLILRIVSKVRNLQILQVRVLIFTFNENVIVLQLNCYLLV